MPIGIDPFLIGSDVNVTDWVTPIGNIGVSYEGLGFDVKVTARSRRGQPVTYALLSGTLPPGLTLNEKSGSISGIIQHNTDETQPFVTYNFTIGAVDQ